MRLHTNLKNILAPVLLSLVSGAGATHAEVPLHNMMFPGAGFQVGVSQTPRLRVQGTLLLAGAADGLWSIEISDAQRFWGVDAFAGREVLDGARLGGGEYIAMGNSTLVNPTGANMILRQNASGEVTDLSDRLIAASEMPQYHDALIGAFDIDADGNMVVGSVGTAAGCFISADKGDSWKLLTDNPVITGLVSMVQWQPAVPGSMMVAGESMILSGECWLMSASGERLGALPPADFDGCVRCFALQEDGKRAYCANTMRVARSYDAGATWEYTLPLPADPDCSIAYQAMVIDPAKADRVFAAVETTSGTSLWMSEDAGESWMSCAKIEGERPCAMVQCTRTLYLRTSAGIYSVTMDELAGVRNVGADAQGDLSVSGRTVRNLTGQAVTLTVHDAAGRCSERVSIAAGASHAISGSGVVLYRVTDLGGETLAYGKTALR